MQRYIFNSFLQNQDCLERKVLHYFYKFCELIYVKVREADAFREIDLSYDKTNSEYILLTLKFDFPTEVCYVQEILELLCQDKFISNLFEMFLQRKFEGVIRESSDRVFVCYL